MKLTKLEHACFMIEKDGSSLIVDPGDLTTNLDIPNNVVAIIVTHEHHDHFDLPTIRKIVAQNPHATIFAPAEVTAQLDTSLLGHAVAPGDIVDIGTFHLEFFGGEHQKPFTDSPVVMNVAVLINDTVYHASDSFVSPKKPVDVLVFPVSGSWMSAQMARDFLFSIKPKIAIPSHDAILSERGKAQCDKYWPIHAAKVNAEYLRPNEAIEV